MFDNHTVRCLRNLALAFVLIVGMFLTNLADGGQALAADNYSAPTDTYQETRNPNRVDTSTEELTKSKIDLPEEQEQGTSIYEQVVDRVNQQRDTSLKGQSNTKTRSEP
ncbi:hypothetical protein IQ255_06125 [Pleurocapsales cyanobacterium LEGE 10410]|nr:hypothetical protein [Pleurocapsales cyanobacterium LEGE 10410]